MTQRILALSLFLFVVACDKADQAFDCNDICTTYRDCADADYDVGECVDRCTDNADADEDFADQADECQACIDGESCVAAAFECSIECAAIVP
jgi:hypothetical protein